MAIHPTRFNGDGTINVRHDEENHEGVITISDVQFGKLASGATDPRFIVLACPVLGCDSYSYHPVSGGSHPVAIQRLAARRFKLLGTIPAAIKNRLGLDDDDVTSWTKAKRLVAFITKKMDGIERYQIENEPEDDELATVTNGT